MEKGKVGIRGRKHGIRAKVREKGAEKGVSLERHCVPWLKIYVLSFICSPRGFFFGTRDIVYRVLRPSTKVCVFYVCVSISKRQQRIFWGLAENLGVHLCRFSGIRRSEGLGGWFGGG